MAKQITQTKTRLEQTIENVKSWELRKGKTELLRHLEGGKLLTPSEAVRAKCYECMGGYPGNDVRDDGKDCKIETCPLYSYMPYRTAGKIKRKELSEEHKQKIAAARQSKK